MSGPPGVYIPTSTRISRTAIANQCERWREKPGFSPVSHVSIHLSAVTPEWGICEQCMYVRVDVHTCALMFGHPRVRG